MSIEMTVHYPVTKPLTKRGNPLVQPAAADIIARNGSFYTGINQHLPTTVFHFIAAHWQQIGFADWDETVPVYRLVTPEPTPVSPAPTLTPVSSAPAPLRKSKWSPRFDVTLDPSISETWIIVSNIPIDLYTELELYGRPCLAEWEALLREELNAIEYHQEELRDDSGFYMKPNSSAASWIVAELEPARLRALHSIRIILSIVDSSTTVERRLLDA